LPWPIPSGSIQRLILSKKFAGKFRPSKLRAAAGCSVHDEHRVASLALGIFLDLAERPIMNPQLWQAFTGGELEIANGVIALGRWWVIDAAERADWGNKKSRYRENSAHDFV
jgi:hypothetical protein